MEKDITNTSTLGRATLSSTQILAPQCSSAGCTDQQKEKLEIATVMGAFVHLCWDLTPL